MAPPVALGGLTSTDRRGVGAHRAHLEQGRLGVLVACTECHIVPNAVSDEGHVDTPWPAEVTFGGRALLADAPTWNTDTLSCSNVYCHGATLSGGQVAEPTWNAPESELASCQGCHGFPPPAPHPQDSACGDCHITAANGGADPATHIDGELQVDDDVRCTACHGEGGSAAPPLGLDGATSPEDPGVGAHATHVDGNPIGGIVPCETCHPVPASLDAFPHLSGTTDVVLSGRAILEGVEASYDPDEHSCTVYCHGASLDGGVLTRPVWNEPQGGACNRCHGFPPPDPHPQETDCTTCHPSGPGGLDSTHLDGTVQQTMDCESCHGGNGSPAPPSGLGGETDPTDPAVGQHQAHLTGTSLSPTAVECADCHPVPATLQDGDHYDGTTDVVFGGRAIANGFLASYTPGDQSCQVACHGAGLSGGTSSTPRWTDEQGGSCDRCHGFPPPAPHPTDTTCTSCHPSGPSSLAATHLDGTLQSTTTCDTCHGGAGDPAPPPALDGATTTADPGVGQHAAHLTGTSLTDAPVPCSTCHDVPTEVVEGTHYNGLTDVVFTGDATLAGFAASYDPSTQTCTVYCHGPSISGGNFPTPQWTDEQGGACNRCHGFPPPSPHPQDTNCQDCHPNVGVGGVLLDPAAHIDGHVDR